MTGDARAFSCAALRSSIRTTTWQRRHHSNSLRATALPDAKLSLKNGKR
jgi:hypothetical protein